MGLGAHGHEYVPPPPPNKTWWRRPWAVARVIESPTAAGNKQYQHAGSVAVKLGISIQNLWDGSWPRYATTPVGSALDLCYRTLGGRRRAAQLV